MIVTCFGVCRNHTGLLLPPKARKPGTPDGMQLWLGVKATLPAITSSLSFFMISFTHGFRFGLVRSAIRYVGCRPCPLGTKGYFGSLATGGTRPGTGRKSPTPIHPTVRSQEKIGGVVFCCATAGTVHAPVRPATTPPASAHSLKVTKDIVVPPLAVSLFPPLGQDHPLPSSCQADGILHRTQRKWAPLITR